MLYARDECPNLAPIAARVLSQTVSSSQCERNWTTFTLIHTKPRNKLGMDRLMHLVFCHYNMRLRQRQLRRTYQNDSNQLIDLDKIFHEDDPLQEWIM
jgi:hAT family C-terminal dimerisation region